jgi:serine/threonine-protein kinase
MGPSSPAATHEPLGQALEIEARRVDLLIARGWQGTSIVGLVFALVVAATIDRGLGSWFAVISLGMLAYSSITAFLLGRNRDAEWLSLASTLVESVVPWLSLLVVLAVRGADYALGSWLPPMIFASILIASIVRLRPTAPLITGISSGAAYIVIYYLAARGYLSSASRELPLYQPSTQLTRALSLALAGGCGSLVAVLLRNIMRRAESAVRAKELFGKYRLLRQVASGGMGTVHEGLYCPEGGFERRVALKRIHPHLAQQEKFVRSFRAEAELSARLVHTNIVQVFDFGRVDESYFLAMEYVDGITLAALMQPPRAFPPRVVAHVGRQILLGLAHSHADALGGDGKPLRVIHRDLSPANVLLSRSGEVKISDFGVARALRDATSAVTRAPAAQVAYTAPEQVQGLPIDERCDLFALGVILWELLAGDRLFQRDNDGATLMALLKQPAPELESPWDAFFVRALAKSASDRFPSAREMISELDRLEPPRGQGDADLLAASVKEALTEPNGERTEAPEER